MPSELLVVVFAVRRGNATYLRTPNGRHILIDLGAGSIKDTAAGFSPLLWLKSRWKVSRLDLAVVTHPHLGHIDDVFNLAGLPPRVLVRPKHLTEDDVRAGNPVDAERKRKIDRYLEMSARYRAPIRPRNSVQAPANNGGAALLHFFPRNCAADNLNNHSVVTVVSYAGTKILIPGDNEQASWTELLANERFVKAVGGTSILLAAHHGQKRGFCPELFRHFRPRLVVASDGSITDRTIVDRYRQVTTGEGCPVRSRSSGESKNRCVLTTRTDGHTVLRCGVDPAGKPYLRVSTG